MNVTTEGKRLFIEALQDYGLENEKAIELACHLWETVIVDWLEDTTLVTTEYDDVELVIEILKWVIASNQHKLLNKLLFGDAESVADIRNANKLL